MSTTNVVTVITGGQPQCLLALDGSGFTILPIADQADVAAVRAAFGNGTEWAPQCNVSAATYTDWLAKAAKVAATVTVAEAPLRSYTVTPNPS